MLGERLMCPLHQLVAGSMLSLAVNAQPAWAPLRLEQLDSDLYAEREVATVHLASDPQISLAEIESIIVTHELSAEQRIRLLQAAGERFRSSPRPAIGINLDLAQNASPTVTGIVPGFDSAVKLKIGDVILEIQGEPILSINDLRRVTFSNSPGDVVDLLIRRDGRELSLDLQLGNFGNLGNARLTAREIEEAWQFRLRSRGLMEDREALETGVLPGAWTQGPPERRRRRESVIAGGFARFEPGASLTVRLDAPLEGDENLQRANLREGLVIAINEIERSLGTVRRQAELQRASLSRGDLTPGRRKQIEDALSIQNRRIAELESRLDRLEAFLRIADQP